MSEEAARHALARPSDRSRIDSPVIISLVGKAVEAATLVALFTVVPLQAVRR